MKIRRYRDPDHDDVWALHNLALEDIGAHAGNGPWDDDLHHIAEIYLEGGGDFLVGLYDARIVAMGALRRSSSDRAEIKRMRVHPDFQRRGFGAAVLQALESRAADLGHMTLHLETTTQQTAAQRLYIRSGYAEVGRAKQGRFDVIYYEKAF